MSLKITYLRLEFRAPGDNGLMSLGDAEKSLKDMLKAHIDRWN